ncbi:MAG TPA: hypothetical protein VKW06_12470 [Candidatus Angelobacter sp.]|nr:hypothetical protein [Candidatus Angelobacter sp.]
MRLYHAFISRHDRKHCSRRESKKLVSWIVAGALAALGLSSVTVRAQSSLGEVARQRSTQRKPAPNAGKPRTNATQPNPDWLQEALQDRELMTEVAQIAERLQKEVPYPAARNQSHILSHLPDSTAFYLAVPNYGETVHRAVEIVQQEIKNSARLLIFLRKNHLEDSEQALIDAAQRFYEVSQFLGDEVVIAGNLQGKEPSGVMIAEIKKPGIRAALEAINSDLGVSAGNRLRIFEPERLAAAGEVESEGPMVLVRQDYIAFGLSVGALRDFNSQIDQHEGSFESRPLGQRLARSYHDGTTSVAGVDLRQLMAILPVNKPQDRMMLDKTGLGDVSYLAVENRLTAGASRSQGELTFTGPRHGIASWLASPAPLGGLDFVSSKSAFALNINLKTPAQLLDDLHDIMGDAAFASVTQVEKQFNLNLKHDLLSKLTGEIGFATPGMYMRAPATFPAKTTLAPDSSPKTSPPFVMALGVADTKGLEQTLAQLLTMAPVQSAEQQEDGVTFHTLLIPGAVNNSTEINYFFLDGYLVMASDRALAEEAVRVHRSGTSLAKASSLRDASGPGQSLNASLIAYQNAGPMMGPIMAQLPPEVRQMLPMAISGRANALYVYADETSIRGVSNNDMQTDAAIGLMLAAVALPNMVQSRTVANESVAVSTLKTVNTAQVAYASTYPERGYAAGLAPLGRNTSVDCTAATPNAEHACLIENPLGDAGCTAGKWCAKNGYKFSVRGVCVAGRCVSYVVSAAPLAASGTSKNFCSTDDGVIRSRTGPSLTAPLTASECRTWNAIR